MEKESGAKIVIRGKGSIKQGMAGRNDGGADNEDAMHVMIQADTEAQVNCGGVVGVIYVNGGAVPLIFNLDSLLNNPSFYPAFLVLSDSTISAVVLVLCLLPPFFDIKIILHHSVLFLFLFYFISTPCNLASTPPPLLKVEAAVKLVMPLLQPMDDAVNIHKQEQLAQLAKWNGTEKDPLVRVGVKGLVLKRRITMN